MANKSPYKKRPITETYKRNLRTWIESEKSKSGLSYRDFAAEFVKRSGVDLTYGSLIGWRNGKLSNEITDDSLRAISKYRGETPEQTRRWLFGDNLPQYDEELGRIIAWMQSAPKELIAIALKSGIEALSKSNPEQASNQIPSLALEVQQAGISIGNLLEECVLDESELELVRLYLEGSIPSLSDRLKDEVQFALNELIPQSSPKTCADSPLNYE